MLGIKNNKRCPNCNSKNILNNASGGTRASKKLLGGMVFLPLALLVGRKKVAVAECFDCGKRWAA